MEYDIGLVINSEWKHITISHAAGARSHTEIDMAELQLRMQRVKLFLRGCIPHSTDGHKSYSR